MSLKRLMICLLTLVIFATVQQPAFSQSTDALRPLVNKLGEGGFKETEAQVGALAATGDPAVAPALEALSSGDLYVRKSDGMAVIGTKAGPGLALTDPLTGGALGTVAGVKSPRSRSITGCAAPSARLWAG